MNSCAQWCDCIYAHVMNGMFAIYVRGANGPIHFGLYSPSILSYAAFCGG